MRLYIARHGQKASERDDYDGGPNPPLTKIGTRQAEHLAEYLEDEGIDAVYSSCQLRSLMTAEPTAERTGVTWNVWPVFAETTSATIGDLLRDEAGESRAASAWPGNEPVTMPFYGEEPVEAFGYRLSDIPDRFPDVTLSQPFPWPDQWWEALFPRFQEKSWARLAMGLQAVINRHEEEDRIAILCHGNIADYMVTDLMDMPRRRQRRRFSFNNTGVCCLESSPDEPWWIEHANCRRHLPDELLV